MPPTTKEEHLSELAQDLQARSHEAAGQIADVLEARLRNLVGQKSVTLVRETTACCMALEAMKLGLLATLNPDARRIVEKILVEMRVPGEQKADQHDGFDNDIVPPGTTLN